MRSAVHIPLLSPKSLELFRGKISPEPMSGCWLWTGYIIDGYGRFSIKKRPYFAHRVSFAIERGHANVPPLLRHTCNISCCVNPDHLVAGTHGDNARDRMKFGTGAFGERHAMAKLTEIQVKQIIPRLAAGESPTKIAREFYVKKGAICFIKANKTWKHLPRPDLDAQVEEV